MFKGSDRVPSLNDHNHDPSQPRSGAGGLSRLGGGAAERGSWPGSGYLYQRRWRAYWITSAVATAWFVAGAVLAQDADAAAEAQNQLVGLIGLLVLAGVTATEAGLALKRVRQTNA